MMLKEVVGFQGYVCLFGRLGLATAFLGLTDAMRCDAVM
jgi:hypothetical protein